EIRANVDKPKHAGLALTNPAGQVIVATAGMPSVLNAVTAYLASGANKDPFMTGPYSGESGLPTISVITPVFGIDDDVNSPALGFLVGIRLLDNEFFDLLNQPGEISLSANNYLVKKSGDMIEYIQNERSLGPNYQPSLDASTPSLAAGFAYENPGKMAEMMNYLGEPVIVSGTKISGSDWVMVRTIGTDEALGGGYARKRNILIISLLVLISLGVLLVLIWRHSISVRLESAMNKQKALAKKHENLSEFMSIVTNSQPTEISAVDEKGNYTFVNLQAAISAGSKPEDMIGKSLAAVLGRAKVRTDEAYCEEVLASHKSKTDTRNIGTDDNPLIYKTDYLPMLIGDDKDIQEKGVLIVKDDITVLEQNRVRREVGLKSLVSTLTMIIGSRDPYSAAHSERVVLVTNMLSKELMVDETTAATAELAGAMMNLGKILVPRELLVKPTNLTVDELTIIRSSMLKSADLVEDIEFEGPVAETLRQIQAHWDGSGQPKNLSGEEILLSARMVSVANAFVGMVSARAHRSGMDMEKAVRILLTDSDTIYDRRPVVALMNYLENKGGTEEWHSFNSPPQELK
ncbi:MAG: hypothetical protein JKY84_13570, partial [Emcibacteraceae bacterium]|nr:hypothetical protein [Emcibacteraceae bacterium]